MSLRQFTDGYIEAALATSTLDRSYEPREIASETRRQMELDAGEFYSRFENRFDDDEIAGYRFWLNRNRHGTGFWDHPEVYGEDGAKALGAASHEFGEFDLYVGDDGRVHGSPLSGSATTSVEANRKRVSKRRGSKRRGSKRRTSRRRR